MNMQSVIKINGIVCEKQGDFIEMYSRKKRLFLKSKKIVENHIFSGKFKSVKVKI